jgi:hypothetical protein
VDSTNRSTSALEINPILRIRVWLGTLNEEQVKRCALSALLLLQIALMAVQSIPPKFFLVTALGGEGLVSALASRVTPYASAIGLFQAWAMFAPNPKRENTYVDAEITYRDGRKHIWVFPQMQELGYAQRYAKERYRKFSNERLIKTENSALWPDSARYIARLNANPSNPPKIVKLANYRCIIPTPPQPGEAPIPERWERYVFFVYTVQPGDLQ